MEAYTHRKAHWQSAYERKDRMAGTSKYVGVSTKKEGSYHITVELNVRVQTPYPVVWHDRGMTPEESRVETAH